MIQKDIGETTATTITTERVITDIPVTLFMTVKVITGIKETAFMTAKAIGATPEARAIMMQKATGEINNYKTIYI